MHMRQILNVAYAWTVAQHGAGFVEEMLTKLLAPVEVVEARENQAGMQALSQLAGMPYAGGRR